MSAFVLVSRKYIEIDDAMIDGASNLMALKYGNNLDQVTIRRFEQLKRKVAEKSKDQSGQGIKPRIKVTVPNKSRCEGSPKRKILKLDQPAASTSGAEPGPSSCAFSIQSASTSRVEPCPSSWALDQSASTSRARRPRTGTSSRAFRIQPASTSRDEPGPSSWASDQSASTSRARRPRTGTSSRAFGIQPASTSRDEPCPSSWALDQSASTSRARTGPSSTAFGIQPSTSRDEPGPSSGALDQPASTSRARTRPASRAFGTPPSTSQVEPGPSISSGALDQPASTSRDRRGPSSRAFGIRSSTSRVHPGPSSRASEQSASTSSSGLDPSLPRRIQDLIGLCSMPIQKEITASDVSPSQCRLMLPRVPTLKLIEHIELKPNEDVKEGIPVTVYGPDGKEYAMTFKVWVGEKSYVINTKSWIQFCQDYELRKYINMATLKIRMFRHRQTDDLCFVITM